MVKSTKAKIGIVVVHYGNPDITLACLHSLNKIQKGKYSLTVFLVDNDPEHRLSLKKFPKQISITRIVSSCNGGFAYGVNKGIIRALQARCEYIFLLNNDTTVFPTIFSELLPYFSKNSRLGMVSSMIMYSDPPDTIWCTEGKVHLPFLFTTYPYMNKKISQVHLPEIIYSDFGAAALLIRAEIFKKIGLFDEKYFLFVEDIEWCLRAKKAGFLLAYVTKPLVWHNVSATSGEKGTNMLTPLGSYLYARNFFFLLADHPDWFNLYFAVIGQLSIRAPFYMLFRMHSIASRVAYVKGIKDGLYYLFKKRVPSLSSVSAKVSTVSFLQ